MIYSNPRQMEVPNVDLLTLLFGMLTMVTPHDAISTSSQRYALISV